MARSSKEQRKKDRERFYAKWFVNNIGWTSCRLVDADEPDFGLELIDKTIGLEVTNLYKGEEENNVVKENEAGYEKWLSRVPVEYYKISEFPIGVQVRIKSGKLALTSRALSCELGKKVTREDVEEIRCELAERLACELARRSDVEIGKKTVFDFNVTDKCVLKISLTRVLNECERHSRWKFVGAHWSREIGETEKEKIQKIICKKAKKLSKYKEKYPEIILLIVSDRTHGSGMFRGDRDLIVNNCGFSSVYLALYPEQDEIIRIA